MIMRNSISKNKLEAINKQIINCAKKMRKSFADENAVIAVYVHEPGMQPRVCAEECNRRYSTNYTGNDIIRIFDGMMMRNLSFRKAVFSDAEDVAAMVLRALQGDERAYDEIEMRLKQNNGRIIETKSKHFERIALVDMFEKNSKLYALPCREEVLKLNLDFAREMFYSIIDLMKLEKCMNKRTQKQYATSEEYENEILRLETNLNRVELMLERLQSDFDMRVEECRADESANLISMLNSPKYGYILDLLTQAQRGITAVKQAKQRIPIEISSLPILVRKLLQFVGDCGITPMLEYGDQIKVTADDVEGYTYEGMPFESDDEVKTVEVISPGWIMEEKQIVISNPRVREMEE